MKRYINGFHELWILYLITCCQMISKIIGFYTVLFCFMRYESESVSLNVILHSICSVEFSDEPAMSKAISQDQP